MKSSQEIIEILETTYPKSMAKTFDTEEEYLRYVERKCSNFEKIFEGVCSEAHKKTSRLTGRLFECYYTISTSDVKIYFSINIATDDKFHVSFSWVR